MQGMGRGRDLAAVLGVVLAVAGPAVSAHAALAGHFTYQWLDLRELRAQVGSELPVLPDGGWAAGFGTLAVFPSGWGLSSHGAELRWQARSGDKASSLSLNHVQVGLVRAAGSRGPWALLGGISLGLASAELELISGEPSTLDGPTMTEWSRYILTVQPEVAVSVRLDERSALLLSAGYLLGTDFWHPAWAHPSRGEWPAVPGLFRGPSVRVALVVGGT